MQSSQGRGFPVLASETAPAVSSIDTVNLMSNNMLSFGLGARRRDAAVWSDPERKLRTLESFARTEADGGRDIAAAARRASDKELRGHLERHARDELKHAELFHRRAQELRAQSGVGVQRDDELDPRYDLSRGRPSSEVDAHGFLKLALFDELGEVSYVAMLHVAEERAAALFERHSRLLHDDPTTRAIFVEILKDEKYHVAYTGTTLARWRTEGRAGEVKAALKSARGSRFLDGWKRLGMRSTAGIGRVVLFLSYYTAVVPFALGLRKRPASEPWRVPPASTADSLRGQG